VVVIRGGRLGWRVLLLCLWGATASAETAPIASADAGEVSSPRAAAPGSARHTAPEIQLTLHSSGLVQAAEALHRGRHKEALKLLAAHDDGTPQADFLRALALLRSGEAGRAEKLLERLVSRLPAIEDRVLWQLAAAREEQEDREGALAAYERIGPDSVLHDEARLARARLLARLGRREEAMEVLRPLADRPAPKWGQDPSARALLQLGELAEKRDRSTAVAAYRKLWTEHVQAPEAEMARRRLEALGAAKLGPQASLRRAKNLVDAHRNEEGAALLRELLPSLEFPSEAGCEARLALGRALRKMRRHSEVPEVLGPVADRCPDPEIRVRALYLLATSTTILDPPRGEQTWLRLAGEFPDHSYADDALFQAAEVARRQGELDRARELLHRLVERYPGGDFRAEALFKLFWLERQQGRLAEALLALFQLEGEWRERPRALYWQGRTLLDLGRPAEALVSFRTLLVEHPASYYALLARGRVQALDPALGAEMRPELPIASEPGLDLAALAGERRFAAAVELLRLGFVAEATAELLRIDRQAIREAAGGSPEPLLAIVYLLDRAGSRQAGLQIARVELAEILERGYGPETALLYRLAYPLAYRDLVEENARRYGVPADLLQALMREESSLDPLVVSWAGAVGLTQLMVQTARSVAKRLGLGPVDAGRLKDPATNVRIGTAYLGSLLQRFEGNWALACAGYNAGPGAVSRWLAARGDLLLDEFVEEIPIDQTRNYVKRVLDSFAAYRLIYGEGEDRFPAIPPGRAAP